jgi:hypothetical protein
MDTNAVKQELEKILVQLGFVRVEGESYDDKLMLRRFTSYILDLSEDEEVWIGVTITEPMEE